MISKTHSRQIVVDGDYTFNANVNGYILKIVVVTDKFILADIDFFTSEEEHILSMPSEIREGKNVFYPKNIIGDKFCNLGQVLFKVKNLKEGETISDIILYFETAK